MAMPNEVKQAIVKVNTHRVDSGLSAAGLLCVHDAINSCACARTRARVCAELGAPECRVNVRVRRREAPRK